jgi:hypothetical protein
VGDIPPENETLWAEAQADETSRFQQSRLRLLWLILGTLALPAAATLVAWLVEAM